MPWQDGALSSSSQISYVSGWEFHTIEPGGHQIADPVVEVLEEGLHLKCRMWQADEDSYAVKLGIDFSEVQHPIVTREAPDVPILTDLPLLISQPELRTTGVEADVRVKDGTGLQLLAESPGSNQDIVILVTFEFLPAE